MADAKRFTWGTLIVGDVKQTCEFSSCAHVGYEVGFDILLGVFTYGQWLARATIV